MNPQALTRFTRIFAAAAAAFTVAIAVAATAQAQGMGYVDARRLIEQAPQGQQMERELEAEFAERGRELKGRVELFQAKEADLEKNRMALAEDDIAARVDELSELERKLRRAQREFNEDIARRRNQNLSKLEKQITAVIQEVAKRKELAVVFQQVVYASEDIDLTDEVLAELKARHAP